MPSFVHFRVAFLLISLCWCGESVTETQAGSPTHKTQSSTVVEMQPGQAYAAGTRVHIPKGGASFVIPAGWHAQLPEDSEVIIAVSESGAGFIMVFMILNLTEEELTALLAEPQPITHDLVFEPIGPVTKKDNRVTAAYEAGSLSGRAVTVMGPNRQGVLFFLGRPHMESSEPDLLLDELADSTEFIATK